MKYTKLSQKINEELKDVLNSPYDEDKCQNHPSHFAVHYLGLKPYRYQHLILRKFRTDSERGIDNYRTIICKSRQIGISICLAILALWMAYYNKYHSGVHNDTKVGIISQDDNSAKKLMKEIQQMAYNSSKDVIQYVRRVRGKPLNKREIHFHKGWIKCFPPTDACRGSTFDVLIVDEASYVDGEIFKDAMEPTVSAVDGKIILSSTPKGVANLFYDLFDPFDLLKVHEYKRYWFHWRMCENAKQKTLIYKKWLFAKKTGNLKSFQQEHEALFTSDVSSFLDEEDTNKGIDMRLNEVYEFQDYPCVVGIDFGGSTAETSISVTSNIKGILTLLFQHSRVNLDLNLLTSPMWDNSVQGLMKRYNVISIVTDDCAQGVQTNTYLEKQGYPLVKFNFRSDQAEGNRNRGYFMFRSWLKLGKIKYPNLKHLIMQLKSLEETNLQITTRIKSPKGYLCDRADSFMLSCYPFMVEDHSDFSSTIVDYEEVLKKMDKEKLEKKHDGRFDHEWEKLQGIPDFEKI